MEYIDKDKVIEEIARLANRSMVGEIDEPYLDWKTVVSVIFYAQAADVQEVRHGKWYWYEEPHSFYDDGFECGWKCSYCNNYPDHDNYVAYNYENKPKLKYCNKCGARMDGKE